MKETMW